MELKGQVVTLYPVVTEGAVVPPNFDPREVNTLFYDELARRLGKLGVNVCQPVPGQPMPSQLMPGLVVAPRLVRIEPGRGSIAFWFGLLGMLFGGASIYEVEGALGDEHGPWTQLHATGRGFNSLGSSKRGLETAATVAANSIAGSVKKTVKAR